MGESFTSAFLVLFFSLSLFYFQHYSHYFSTGLLVLFTIGLFRNLLNESDISISPLMLIQSFDPWSGRFCTCPPKYSLNPYTGCSHGCLYCYITSYIPQGFHCRPKKNLILRLSQDLTKCHDRYLSISNSSDPYPPEEKKYKLMTKILPLLKDSGIKVLLVTKSNLITRDIPILRTMSLAVSLSITTLDTDWAQRIEPHAPPPSKRLHALKLLSSSHIPCSVRLDPIIPGVNDEEITDIITAISPYCKHVVSSTVKPRRDAMKRLSVALPDIVTNLSFQLQGNTYYLPKKQRYSLMKKVKKTCEAEHLTFATCREGFPEMHTATCDGSHLI